MKKHIDEINEDGITYSALIRTKLGAGFSARDWTPVIEQDGSDESDIIIACFNEEIATKVSHCLNTHQQLLDALKYVTGEPIDETLKQSLLKVVESASFVEVSE